LAGIILQTAGWGVAGVPQAGVTEVTDGGIGTGLSSRQHLNLSPSTHRRDCPPPVPGFDANELTVVAGPEGGHLKDASQATCGGD